MTERALVLTGFAVLVAAGIVAEIAARRYPDRLTSLGATTRSLLRARWVRILVILVWAWLGWHFLAR